MIKKHINVEMRCHVVGEIKEKLIREYLDSPKGQALKDTAKKLSQALTNLQELAISESDFKVLRRYGLLKRVSYSIALDMNKIRIDGVSIEVTKPPFFTHNRYSEVNSTCLVKIEGEMWIPVGQPARHGDHKHIGLLYDVDDMVSYLEEACFVDVKRLYDGNREAIAEIKKVTEAFSNEMVRLRNIDRFLKTYPWCTDCFKPGWLEEPKEVEAAKIIASFNGGKNA